MNITCDITNGMNPQEKATYFAHMEKRHREEAEYVDARKAEMRDYKRKLIADAIKRFPHLSIEELQKKSVRALELMA